MGSRNVQRLLLDALTEAFPFDLEVGEVMKFLPDVDDQGAINIGDGTTDMDVKIFLGDANTFVDFNVGDTQMKLRGVDIDTNTVITASGGINTTGEIAPSGAGFVKKKVNAITANTTLNTTHFGGIVTNRGAAGAIVLTIPDASAALSGAWFEYFGVVDQNATFTAATADTLIALNDAAADSVVFNTANEKIGAHAVFVCDGTSWIAAGVQGTLSIVT